MSEDFDMIKEIREEAKQTKPGYFSLQDNNHTKSTKKR